MNDPLGTILIVEDEPHDVEFLQRAFAHCGVRAPIHAVANGEEAARYLRGEGCYADRQAYPFPRVIVTDLKMPHLGGLELLQWIKTHCGIPIVPTIVLTSSTSQADIDAAFAHGACGYMVKPVSLETLEEMVKTIAAYWRLSRAPRPAPRGLS